MNNPKQLLPSEDPEMDALTVGIVPVRLYLRAPAEGWHSIERVFATVFAHLPSDIDAEVVTLARPTRGVLGRLRGLIEKWTRAPGVHHVTGDVHFLVLAMPWRRTVLTIHDLVRLNELRGPRRWVYRLLWFTLPVLLASAVTVISDQTGRDLLEEFPNAGKKLHVIPNPLPSGLGGGRPQRSENSNPVILHVGTTANKNLELSVTVAQRLGAELRILGRLSEHQWDALNRSGTAFSADHDVPDERLADVYRSADVLLFASLAEGFGMPIIEAQACGVPVVTSDREPMRSVAGGAALLVDPLDVDAAAGAVMRILKDSDLRASLCESGRANAERYLPDTIAEQYAAVYRTVLGSTAGSREGEPE